jgi:ubiquinone/menaquinone biosynthesis C-methylase UbiE
VTENPDKKSGKKAAAEMDAIAKGPFAPIYPVIARDIVATCGITSGSCLDAGSGPAHLAIALSRVTELSIDALDASPEMVAVARRNIAAEGLEGRIRAVVGDVHALPYGDGTFDLVVSRGSVFFWDDPRRAFSEMYRVLKPGGATFIGGGFGNAELTASITRTMRTIHPGWEDRVRVRMSSERTGRIRDELAAANVPSTVREDERGFWILIRK